MSKLTAFIDRFIFFFIAVGLIVFGLWPVLVHFDVQFAKDLALWRDPEAWKTLPEHDWYEYLLWGVLAGSIIIGLWLIVINLRRRTFSQVGSSASDSAGEITMHIGHIAKAVAAQLATDSDITSAKHKVSIDRARPTIEFTVNARPEADLNKLNDMIETSEADLRDAIEDVDIDTVYRLHMDKVEPAV